MSSLYETKYDVIYRKLQERKLNLKKQFDEAYSRDDFQASMAVMEDIQKVMGSLSSLEILEKPFKETARVASRVEDIRVELEILLESLGKEIRTLDGLQEILNKDLSSQMSMLLKMFREEDGKNFQFDFEKFSSSELMALMQYEATYFPSRKEEFELHIQSSQQMKPKDEVPFSEADWNQPLAVLAGVGLSGLCVLEKEETQEAVSDEPEESAEEVPFDHGVEDLSEFGRQNDIPVLTDSETATILAQTEEEPQEEISDIAFSEPEPITSEDVLAYAREVEALPAEMTEEELQQDLEAEIHQGETLQDEQYATEEYAQEEYAEEPESGYSAEAYAEESYGEEAYAEEAYAEEPYAEEAYAEEAYTEEAYPEEAYSDDAYAEEAYPEDAYAGAEYSEEAYAEDVYTEEPVYEASVDYATETEYSAEGEYAAEDVYATSEEYAAQEDYSDPIEYSDVPEISEMEYPLDETAVMDVSEDLVLNEEVNLEDSVSLDVDSLGTDISDSIEIGEEPVMMQELEISDLDIDLNENPEIKTSPTEPVVTEALDIDDIQIDLDNLD
ncbi:MAG: hypothetical protein H3C47_05455 [Candidatus Cloacimonetes bacterium]|nr:hypothetical protein [Candidatus Cloacimonadota bacterium]